MKKTRSILATILCIAIVVSIFAVFPLGGPAAKAYTSLPGVEEIKQSSGSFNILELVPESGSGSIGWYVGGQEPGANWAQDRLASISGTSPRETAANNYLASLQTAGLLGTSGNTPLHKTGVYKEYAPWQDRSGISGLKTLMLSFEDTYDVIGAFNEAPSGGEYRADNTYTVSAGGSGGNYDQDIFGLSLLDGVDPSYGYYYTLGAFAPLSAFGNVDDGLFIFRVVPFNADGNGLMRDPFDVALDASHQIVPRTNINSGSAGGLTYLVFEGCMGSSYLTGLNLQSAYYTAPFTVSTSYSSSALQFGVAANGFIAVASGKGHFDAETLSYTYVGHGAAEADFNYSPAGTSAYKVKTKTLYYAGGFTNNNWFLKHVFDWESGELAPAIKVRSLTAPAVTADDVAAADMIVLSRGFLTSAAYSSGNDLSAAAEAAIRSAGEARLPIIVDHSLRGSTGLRIGQLAAFLTAGRSEPHFVSNNIYCISPTLASAAFNAAIDGNHQLGSSPFYAVWYEIDYENFLRLQNNPNAVKLPEKVSIATCIRYIINYGGQRIITQKTDIRVLELQPAGGTALTKQKVNDWTGISTSRITIDTMSTSEFIGKIDNLVETYDLIYIGSSFTGLPTTGSGANTKTNYTDTLMNGLIYSNIGDRYVSGSQLTGLLDRDYSANMSGTYNRINHNNSSWTFRLSGNDITKGKASELLDFAAAGYPIVTADNLMGGVEGQNAFSFTAQVTENDGALLAGAIETEGTTIPYGTTKTYQWYRKNTGSGSDTLVSSSGSSYTPPQTAGTYYCKITIGGQTAVSNTVDLAITKVYTATPRSPNNATSRTYSYTKQYAITIARSQETTDQYNFSVSVDPNDEAFTYQWQQSTYSWFGWGSWGNISSATGSSYTYTYGNNERRLRCRVRINGNWYDSLYATHNSYEANPPRVVREVSGYSTVYNAAVEVAEGAGGVTLTARCDPPVGTNNNFWYKRTNQGSGSWTSGNTLTTSVTGTYHFRLSVNGSTSYAVSNEYTVSQVDRKNFTVNDNRGPAANVPAVLSTLTVNPATVDYCSQLYSFLDTITNYSNVFRESGATVNSSTLIQYLNLSKPKIVFSKNTAGTPLHPPEYTGPYTGPSLSSHTLSYTFTIENATDVTPAETRYYCNLYIDMNADGRYDYTEQLADILITDGDGNVIRTGELKAGVVYTVTRTMPEEYVGIVPWQLEVVKTTQSRVHASEHNYTHIKGTPKTIYVLQLLHNGALAAGLNLATDQTYQRLLGDIRSDFIVEISTLNVANLSAVTTGTVIRKDANGQNETRSYSSLEEYLNTFDMLILGFADAYRELDRVSANAVVNFINNPSGKSVLFTHDTTSIVNLPVNQYPATNNRTIDQPSSYFWGYYFNTLLRDAVGLDRYGVTNRDYGITNYSPNKDPADKFGNDKNGINVAAGAVGLNKVNELTGAGYSIAYAPQSRTSVSSSTAKSTLAEVQGFTNYTLRRYGEWGGGISTTTQVSQVNEGQITTYPFDLNLYGFGGNTNSSQQTMTIATTHEQYYQLNMNSDDIVVWYCLAGGGADKYSSLPNDVVNAYYIYSVGNVTYSGAGHSYAEVKEPEAKLFINTMIAAYQTAATPPEISIIDPSDPTGNTKLTYKFYAADDDGALPVGEHFRDSAIYFTVTDPSLGSGKKITAKFTYSHGAESHEIALPIYVKGGSASPINGLTGAENNYTLAGGATYYIYPSEELLEAIGANDRVNFKIEIVSNKVLAQPASDEITLHKLWLFPLG